MFRIPPNVLAGADKVIRQQSALISNQFRATTREYSQ